MREEMDSEQRKEQTSSVSGPRRKGKKRRKVRYFYVNGHLHKVLSVHRGQDLMTAWDYIDGQRKMYVLSDVRKRMQNAFTITEVAEMLQRHRMTIDGYIRDGMVRTPQRSYNLFTKRPGKFWLSEDDVLDMHEYMMTLHRGAPRKDGLITSSRLPDRASIKALVKQDVILYTQDDEGRFIPIWKEQVW